MEEFQQILMKSVEQNFKQGIKFISGINEMALMSELRQVIVQLKSSIQMLDVAIQQDVIAEQWKVIFKHPLLQNLDLLKSVLTRVSTSSNSEAGCEQSNSKFNRAKNKLSSTMKLPMIKARMRVGSNGPPLHMFNAEPVLNYWQEDHRLAQKSWIQSMEDSLVISRIQKSEEMKYTSKMYT